MTKKGDKNMTTKTAEPQGAEVLEGDYNGKAMLIIRQSPHDKFPFQFGVKKARLIVEHIDDIKAFIERHPAQI